MSDDDNLERWITRALEQAPALDADQADLLRRTYGRSTHQTTGDMPDAA